MPSLAEPRTSIRPIASSEARAPTAFLPRWLWSRGLRALLVILAAGALLLQAIDALGGPTGLQERFGQGAALILVPTQIVVSASPVPGELVAAVSVAIYGFWLGAALCWLGWFGAAFLEYGLVRWSTVGAGASAASGMERLPRFLQRLPADHPTFLIFTRFLPFGAHIVNVTAGLKRVPL